MGRHWDYLRSVLVAALASAPISKQNVEKHILTAVFECEWSKKEKKMNLMDIKKKKLKNK